MKCKIYEDSAGEYRWKLIADNGKIVADSGEGYASKANARRAASRLFQAIYNGSDIIHI